MQEEKLLRIVRECSETIERNFDEVSKLDSVKSDRIDGAKLEFQKKIESQKRRIADLRRYRDEYSNYIRNVYSRFDKLYDDLRQNDRDRAKKTYDKLHSEWQSAKQAVLAPIPDSYQMNTGFFDAIFSGFSFAGGLKYLVNFLLAVSYLVGFAIFVYIIYLCFAATSAGSLFSNVMLRYSVFAYVGFNVFVCILKIANSGMSRKELESMNQSHRKATLAERENEAARQRAELQKFIDKNLFYVTAEGAWRSRSLSDIDFVDSINQDVLDQAIKETPSPVDTAVYQGKYQFKLKLNS